MHGGPSDADVASVVRGRPTAELSKLYVHPAQHGGGVAAALIDTAVAAAAAGGARSVWLGVNIHNVRANRFYEKSGFAVVGKKGFALGEVIEEDWVRERTVID
jgi:ribosomal protein S18 acetylase RimI-like enzyme